MLNSILHLYNLVLTLHLINMWWKKMTSGIFCFLIAIRPLNLNIKPRLAILEGIMFYWIPYHPLSFPLENCLISD